MVDRIAIVGPGYKAHSYRNLRLSFLAKSKKEINLFFDSFISTWGEYGCTVIANDCLELKN